MLLPISAHAAAALEFGSVTAAPDQTARVPVYLTADSLVAAVEFEAHFDPAQLAAGAPRVSPGASEHTLAFNKATPGLLKVVIYSRNNAFLPIGEIVQLEFTPAPSVGQATVSLTPAAAIAANVMGDSVAPIVLKPGQIHFTTNVRPQFQGISGAGGQVTLELKSTPGRAFTIEMSTDLKSWSILRSATIPSDGVARLVDPLLQAPGVRFYRAVQQ